MGMTREDRQPRDSNTITKQKYCRSRRVSETHRAQNPRQGLRIDPGRLVSKLLDIFKIGARINGGIAVGAALTAQFQHT